MSRSPACDDLGLPHGITYARLYPRGWCCDLHTPSALQGRPESPPGPGWPAGPYLGQTTTEPPEQPE